jgi:uncharacterized protein YuzE
MKFNDFAETNSLYIDLSSNTSLFSKEMPEGIVRDCEAGRKISGIDIDNTS